MRNLSITSIFSERIKALRLKSGVSQKELAKTLEISQAALGNYERDARCPDINFLVNAAKYYNITADYLLGISNLPTMNAKYYEKILAENMTLRERLNQIERLCRLTDK